MKYTEEEKKEYVDKWKETSISRKRYSEDHSLCYHSFLSWTKEYQQECINEEDAFIKLGSTSFGSSKIMLPNGVLIQTEQSLSVALLKCLSDV